MSRNRLPEETIGGLDMSSCPHRKGIQPGVMPPPQSGTAPTPWSQHCSTVSPWLALAAAFSVLV